MNSSGLVDQHEAIRSCVEGCCDYSWLEVPCDGKGLEGKPHLVVMGEDLGVNRDHVASFFSKVVHRRLPCWLGTRLRNQALGGLWNVKRRLMPQSARICR